MVTPDRKNSGWEYVLARKTEDLFYLVSLKRTVQIESNLFKKKKIKTKLISYFLVPKTLSDFIKLLLFLAKLYKFDIARANLVKEI